MQNIGTFIEKELGEECFKEGISEEDISNIVGSGFEVGTGFTTRKLKHFIKEFITFIRLFKLLF